MTNQDTTKNPTGLALYTLAAERASSEVIASYSTSFGLAAKLLGPNIRQHVENIYALVRVADEIVDGAAAEAVAAGGTVDPASALTELEVETYRALKAGFSTNLVVHAFAYSARLTGFGEEIIRPFFHSMRLDLTEQEYDQAGFDEYVYGSAEVVGLMCLRAFMLERAYTEAETEKLVLGARALGSAFQKVNFLRDLAADFKALGRSYFPGVAAASFTEQDKIRLVADIQADLAVSAASLPLLPRSSSRAVSAAHLLFEELNQRIAKTPAAQLIETRIRVPNPVKFWILLKALIGVLPK